MTSLGFVSFYFLFQLHFGAAPFLSVYWAAATRKRGSKAARQGGPLLFTCAFKPKMWPLGGSGQARKRKEWDSTLPYPSFLGVYLFVSPTGIFALCQGRLHETLEEVALFGPSVGNVSCRL